MADIRNITKEDIHLKARMISEGVHINMESLPPAHAQVDGKSILASAPKPAECSEADGIIWRYARATEAMSASNDLGRTVILDGCNLPSPVYPNKNSRLEMTIDGDQVIITDDGNELATGRMPKRKEWINAKLSNGVPITAALPGMSAAIINVVFNWACNNWNTNRGCRYCGLFASNLAKGLNQMSLDTLKELAKYQAEAVKIATDHGWRGSLAISGGAFTRSQRPNYLDRLEIVLEQLHEVVGEEALSRLALVYNHYPPEDFNDMNKWKEMGIGSTSIDLEVLDPAYFAAICPGKHAYKPLPYWKEAQEASVEIFGPIMRTTGCVVVGIEPMKSLTEGIDERLSKGVMPLPLVFFSAKGSPYEGFRAPTADWIVEASEKIAQSYMTHVPKFMKAMTPRKDKSKNGNKKSGGGGMMKAGRSSHLTVVFDEIMRRVQEIGVNFASKKEPRKIR